MYIDLTAHILTGLFIGWWWHHYYPIWGLVAGITLGFVGGVYHVWKKYAPH